MQNVFKKRYDETQSAMDKFVGECLEFIVKIVNERGGSLSFGNTVITVNDNEPYVNVNDNEAVKMYSQEGWIEPYDIAHWADVVLDVDKCYKAGNTRYTGTWNKDQQTEPEKSMEYERIAIINHETHELFVEDIPTDILNGTYNGEEEDYIKDNYPELKSGEFSWDYIWKTEFVPAGDDPDPIEVEFENLV